MNTKAFAISFADFRHGPDAKMVSIQRLYGGRHLARARQGDHNMIRIETANTLVDARITVVGQLVGEYTKEVETLILKAIEQHKDVHLFLRDVSTIDETGHGLLSRLAAQGVKLSAAGLYSSYIVAEIQRKVNLGKL